MNVSNLLYQNVLSVEKLLLADLLTIKTAIIVVRNAMNNPYLVALSAESHFKKAGRMKLVIFSARNIAIILHCHIAHVAESP